MILPIFLFMTVLSVDLGRLMFLYGATADATYVTARAAAQAGGGTVGTTQVAVTAWNNTVANIPGVSASQASLIQTQPLCSSTQGVIKMEGRITFSSVTPGLDSLFHLVSGGNGNTGLQGYVIKTKAYIMCEVVR